MSDNKVLCPLLGRKIKDIECIETSDMVDGLLKKENIPEEYKKKKNWIEICKNCKWHSY